MTRRSRFSKKTKVRGISIRVTGIKFEIKEPSPEKDKPGSKPQGKVFLEYERYDQNTGQNAEIQVDFPLASIWGNQGSDGLMAIRAHFALGARARQDQLGFFRDVFRLGQVTCRSSNYAESHAIQTTRQRVFRYGPKADANTSWYNNDISMAELFFDTKAQALKAVLQEMNNYRLVGGLQLTSLQTVGDDVLQQIGFTRIPDLLGKSPDMWRGQPNLFYHTHSRSEAAQKEIKAVVEDFLQGLQRELAA